MKEPLGVCDDLHGDFLHSKMPVCVNWRSAPIVTAAKDMSAQALESGALGEASAPAAPPDPWGLTPEQRASVEAGMKDVREGRTHTFQCEHYPKRLCFECAVQDSERWYALGREDQRKLDTPPTDAAPKDQTQAAIDEAVRVVNAMTCDGCAVGNPLEGGHHDNGDFTFECLAQGRAIVTVILPILRSGK